MALNLVVGKPGSGKSYYMVRRLYNDFIMTFAQSTDGRRSIYTNLPLNLIEINKQLKLDGITNYDVFDYVYFLDDNFFDVANRCRWWEKFPVGALIIIDEVQYYLSSQEGKDKVTEEYLKEFTNYISTHRHYQHDLFFLTQHPDNIQKSVLNMAEGCYQIQNIKGKVIPYLGIPIVDIDEVRRAFGNEAQWALVIFGLYVGRAFKKESTFSLLLESKYFRLYSSHFSGDSDRPKLNLSRCGAIIWFLKRHLWHLALKGAFLYVVVVGLYSLVVGLPGVILSKSGLKRIEKKSSEIKVAKKLDIKEEIKPKKIEVEIKPILETPLYIIYSDGSKKFINCDNAIN